MSERVDSVQSISNMHLRDSVTHPGCIEYIGIERIKLTGGPLSSKTVATIDKGHILVKCKNQYISDKDLVRCHANFIATTKNGCFHKCSCGTCTKNFIATIPGVCTCEYKILNDSTDECVIM